MNLSPLIGPLEGDPNGGDENDGGENGGGVPN